MLSETEQKEASRILREVCLYIEVWAKKPRKVTEKERNEFLENIQKSLPKELKRGVKIV